MFEFSLILSYSMNVMFIFTAIIRLISVVETSQKNKSTLQKDAKIQSYSLEFKLSVIENAEEHGNSPTVKI